MEMPTSTGQRRQMRRAGSLKFSVKGKPYTLTAFVEADAPDMNRLFVPFGDLTNGTETYAAGRYIDLMRTPTGPVRGGLQPRVPPVLLLQPDLRLPLSASGEPVAGARARGRTDEAMTPAAIVFDFDGVSPTASRCTCARSRRRCATSWASSCRPTSTTSATWATTTRARCARCWRIAGVADGEARVAAIIEDKAKRLPALLSSPDVLMPGAAACIARLAACRPLAIASGARRDEIELVLAARGLAAPFDVIVAAGETPRSKPHPDPYARAVSLLAERGRIPRGTSPSQCVAIEDSHWGIASAKQAGLRCVGITSSYARHELVTADRVIDVPRRVDHRVPRRNSPAAGDHARRAARVRRSRGQPRRRRPRARGAVPAANRVPRGGRRGRDEPAHEARRHRHGAHRAARLEALAQGAGGRAQPAALRRRGVPGQRRAVRGPAQQLPQRRRRPAHRPADRAVRGLPGRGAPGGRARSKA